ncbi:hypothetical protein GQ457_17G010280 [Hibiscus cannabinus]
MKAIMRRRFIPTHYHRELFNKLQNLKQSNRSVEDYYKEMEVAMIRANIDEDREATMAKFLAGLDPDIANVVELQHYIDIDDMVHMAMKVEKQLKRKGAARPYASNTSKWGHGSNKKNVAIPTKDGSGSSKPNKPIIESNKGKNTSTPVRSRDVQCFKCLGRDHIASQCPNRNAMFIRENGEIESDHEEEEETEVPIDEEEMEFAVDGEALVVKRSLSTQVMESEQQRENIFHTRCHVNGKVCFVIIDGGSCTNVASNLMIEKLGLPTTKHPQPYKLQWLNDGGEIKVTKHARIPFSIGKYKDEILCDVVPMHAGHLLLGRPWQFDRRAIHDGFTNIYSFDYEGKKITLAPLTPRQVHEDQIHLRKSIEKAKESEKDRVEKSKEGPVLDELVFVPVEGLSGGLITVWDSTFFIAKKVVNQRRWIALIGSITHDKFKTVLLNIYAPNDISDRRELFVQISGFIESLKIPVIVGGDFNCVLCNEERIGSLANLTAMRHFSEFIQTNNLIDLPMVGRPYMWFKGGSMNLLVSLIDFLYRWSSSNSFLIWNSSIDQEAFRTITQWCYKRGIQAGDLDHSNGSHTGRMRKIIGC